MNQVIDNMRISIDKTAQNIVQLLSEMKLTLTSAESCTGGLLSGAVTGVSGASQVFELGVCAYANHIKQHVLGVSRNTLKYFGAVSAYCAVEMAAGARRTSGANVGISVTGIAGPDGGSTEKPVGTVFLACSYKDRLNVLHLRINHPASQGGEFTREYIRLESVRQALILIRDTITVT
jgi:PncC family amidohydrolase